jgi:hypothetical protein
VGVGDPGNELPVIIIEPKEKLDPTPLECFNKRTCDPGQSQRPFLPPKFKKIVKNVKN